MKYNTPVRDKKKESEMTSTEAYKSKLDLASVRPVSPFQFQQAALEAGWEIETIRLFLKPPLWNQPVLVGQRALALNVFNEGCQS